MTIETEIAALTVATTDLITEVVDQKDTLAAQATAATNSASAAASSASAAASSASAAATSEANAAAVVTGGTAALTPAAGLIPLADGAGKIANGWLPNNPAFSGEIAANGGIALGDNDKATFGAGDDLQIYHDGSNSYIDNVGSGSLIIQDTDGTGDIYLRPKSGQTAIGIYNDNTVQLAYSGNIKLSTTVTGIDVTGTITADGLTVDGDSEIRSTLDATLNITSTAYTINSGNVYGSLNFVTEDGSVASGRKNAATIQAINSGGSGSYCDLDFYTSAGTEATNTKSLKIASNGDVSFYEDTGTTPKLFWDASAESLGIGTSSPSATSKLHVIGTAGASNTAIYIQQLSSNVALTTNSLNASTKIHDIQWYGTDLASLSVNVGGNGVDWDLGSVGSVGANTLKFTNVAGDERMRIDSSGNLLVSTTSAVVANSVSNVGTAIGAGLIESARAGVVAQFNRHTTDGSIIDLQKAGEPVGSIGTAGDDLLVGTGDTAFRFHDGDNRIYPVNVSNGVKVDGAVALGDPTARFKDLYLSGGVYLGGTGAANLLDSYEEGSWTPTVAGDATGVIDTGTQGSYYTKVGNLVTIYMNFRVTTNFTSSSIGGLPFQANHPDLSSSWLSCGPTLSIGTNTISAGIQNTTSVIRLYENQNLSTPHVLNITNDYYRFVFSYRT